MEYGNTTTLVLHQRALVKKLLARLNMKDCNLKSAALDVNLDLRLKDRDCPDSVDPVLEHGNRESIGSLTGMYLKQCTRVTLPDFDFAVTILCRYLHKARMEALGAS